MKKVLYGIFCALGILLLIGCSQANEDTETASLKNESQEQDNDANVEDTLSEEEVFDIVIANFRGHNQVLNNITEGIYGESPEGFNLHAYGHSTESHPHELIGEDLKEVEEIVSELKEGYEDYVSDRIMDQFIKDQLFMRFDMAQSPYVSTESIHKELEVMVDSKNKFTVSYFRFGGTFGQAFIEPVIITVDFELEEEKWKIANIELDFDIENSDINITFTDIVHSYEVRFPETIEIAKIEEKTVNEKEWIIFKLDESDVLGVAQEEGVIWWEQELPQEVY